MHQITPIRAHISPDTHSAGTITKIQFFDSSALSYSTVLNLLVHRQDFRQVFIKTLAGSSFEAFFWETPPVTTRTLNKPFECVLVEGKSLCGLHANPSSFLSHLEHHQHAAAFPNLGGDALLIAPTPSGPQSWYTHLAAFLRCAPDTQVEGLLRLVGETIIRSISNKPIWVSTAGMGVPWLHLRIDSSPKYYRHLPYRQMQS